MERLFKIGEAADMFDTSIRALRLYDKIGLLKPEHIDKKTGYRYYTADQMQVLNTILVLKAIGIKLSDIKRIFDAEINPDLLINVLQKKQEFWENQIEIAKFNIENIEKIKSAVQNSKPKISENSLPDAYKMSRMVCLENLKTSITLSEALWL